MFCTTEIFHKLLPLLERATCDVPTGGYAGWICTSFLHTLHLIFLVCSILATYFLTNCWLSIFGLLLLWATTPCGATTTTWCAIISGCRLFLRCWCRFGCGSSFAPPLFGRSCCPILLFLFLWVFFVEPDSKEVPVDTSLGVLSNRLQAKARAIQTLMQSIYNKIT